MALIRVLFLVLRKDVGWLKLESSDAEGVYLVVVPLLTVSFAKVVPAVVERVVLNTTALHASQGWLSGVESRVPFRVNLVEETEYGHENQYDEGKIKDDDDDDVEWEHEELLEEYWVSIDHGRCHKGK